MMKYFKSVRNDEVLTPNSVNSQDSYEIFGSACSEISDCEDFEYRKTRFRTNYQSHQSSPNIPSPCGGFLSAMNRDEYSPMLGSKMPTSYKTLDGGNPNSLNSSDLSPEYTFYKKHIGDSDENAPKKQSSLVTIFSVWNTIMGSSLLSLAWGVGRAGLLPALLILPALAALCLYTAHILLNVNKNHGKGSVVCEVPALCGQLLGERWRHAAHACSIFVLIGATLVYWILLTNFLFYTVNFFIDLETNNGTKYNSSLLCPKLDVLNSSLQVPVEEETSPYWGLHSTVPVYVAVIVFPLLNFRNVTFFTKFNSLGTLSVLYLVAFVIVRGVAWGIHMPPVDTNHEVKDAAVLSGMLALSFYIHNIIITVMSNNEKQENNGRDLTIAFLLVTVTYTLVGTVFYICFPLAKACIEDNILNNFERHDIMTVVARILLLFQVVTIYPLVTFMLRSEAILLLPIREEFKANRWLTVAINSAIVTACILFACFCPNIGTIIRYTGALSGLVHVFALPSLLQIRSLQLQGRLTWWRATFFLLIILFGAVNLLMQFYIR